MIISFRFIKTNDKISIKILFSDLTSCGQMMTAAGQYYRSSAAAAAQMRSVYNPAGNYSGQLILSGPLQPLLLSI